MISLISSRYIIKAVNNGRLPGAHFQTILVQTYNLDIVRHLHELKPLLNQPLPLFVLDEVALVALQEDGQLGQTAEEQGREGRG